MENSSQYIFFDTHKLHYVTFGSGKNIIVAFHGYGQDAQYFSELENYTVNNYTILSIDLPYHGKSFWDETKFTKGQLGEIIKQILTHYNVNKISLLGYSLGGKVCFTIIEIMPEVIEHVVLLAPAEMQFNVTYFFATSTYLGNLLFKYTIKKPLYLILWNNLLFKIKIMNASRHKFFNHFLQSDILRIELYNIWMAMRQILPKRKKLYNNINKNEIPISIFIGAFDSIITLKSALKFKNKLNTVQIHILQKGHKILDNSTAQQIMETFIQK